MTYSTESAMDVPYAQFGETDLYSASMSQKSAEAAPKYMECRLGDRIQLKDGKSGIVRFIGKNPNSSSSSSSSSTSSSEPAHQDESEEEQELIGIELDESSADCDSSLNLFDAPPCRSYYIPKNTEGRQINRGFGEGNFAKVSANSQQPSFSGKVVRLISYESHMHSWVVQLAKQVGVLYRPKAEVKADFLYSIQVWYEGAETPLSSAHGSTQMRNVPPIRPLRYRLDPKTVFMVKLLLDNDFSPRNQWKSSYMWDKMDEHGWVAIDNVLKFKWVADLIESHQLVTVNGKHLEQYMTEAAAQSRVIELDDGARQMRSVFGWQDDVKANQREIRLRKRVGQLIESFFSIKNVANNADLLSLMDWKGYMAIACFLDRLDPADKGSGMTRITHQLVSEVALPMDTIELEEGYLLRSKPDWKKHVTSKHAFVQRIIQEVGAVMMNHRDEWRGDWVRMDVLLDQPEMKALGVTKQLLNDALFVSKDLERMNDSMRSHRLYQKCNPRRRE